ncbi:MAG TPA: hypothetical protein PLU30_17200 [Verrucomicrobiae bacterium]|nr:hypothetical protein [Verrucomicrobiae bacterium]
MLAITAVGASRFTAKHHEKSAVGDHARVVGHSGTTGAENRGEADRQRRYYQLSGFGDRSAATGGTPVPQDRGMGILPMAHAEGRKPLACTLTYNYLHKVMDFL